MSRLNPNATPFVLPPSTKELDKRLRELQEDEAWERANRMVELRILQEKLKLLQEEKAWDDVEKRIPRR